MKKVIFVKVNEITNYHIQLINDKFPNGYEYDDIHTVKNAEGNYLKVIITEDDSNIFYFQVSIKLEEILEKYWRKNPSNPEIDLYFDDYL